MRPGPMKGNKSSGKSKNFSKSIKELVLYSKKYWSIITFCMVLAIVSSIISIIAPNKIRDLTDLITVGLFGKIDFIELKSLAMFLLSLYIVSSVMSLVQNLVMATVSNKFSRDLRDDISKKINRLPLKYFDNNTYGDILSRITNDVDTINGAFQNSIISLISAVALLIGSLIMMFYTNWIMAVTTIVSTIIGFLLMLIILSKSQKYFVEKQEALGDLNGHIEEIYSNHNIVKVYNGKKDSNEKFDVFNKREYKANRKSQFLSGIMQPIMMFSGDFSYVAVCVVGAILASKGIITFGVIMAFILYVRIFTGPLRQIAMGLTQLQSAAAAGERVFEFMNEKELTKEKSNTKKLEIGKVKGNIEFKKVNFGYDKNKLIIKNFSAKAKAGQKIAIVGPTGAGKTTLVNLLMRFYDINDGDILIDKVSVKDLTRENLRDLFIMILQDTWVFEGTIRENIAYNKEDVSDKEIMDIAKKIGLDHFINTMNKGLDYKIIDQESISAGQRQLMTIARGMVSDAPFLILDEATSNVDTRTEELVQKAMDRLMKGRTSFVIAHRLSTIKNADLILVLNEGNIVEQGTHTDLLKKDGFYAELYNSQFSKLS